MSELKDFKEKDVTDMSADALVRLINTRLRTYKSVELFKRDGRLILRSWRVAFDVSEYEGEDEA